jgi:cation:H+ antiporter
MSPVLVAFIALLLSAGFVYWACEYFVNGVEWFGSKAGISQTAVGTVLAAFGTALPESVVTFVAVVFGRNAAAKDIGVGAALGGPLVLATIAYPIVGIMLLITRSQPPRLPIDVNRRRLGHDQSWFLLLFACKIALGFLAFAIKPLLGWVFLAAYGLYTWSEMRQEADEPEGELKPLKFQPKAIDPGWFMVTLQTILAIAVIFAASHVFVGQLETVGAWLGISSTVVALLLSPVATELPETMNAIIWIKQGKHRLALSNISGSMMVQATIPTALGLLFTPWLFDGPLTLAGIVTALAIIGLLVLLRLNALTPRRLSAFALLYVVFGIGVWVLLRGIGR